MALHVSVCHHRRRLLPALTLLPLAGLAACARPEPEQQIRRAIGEMETAIRARRNGDFMAHVAEDFRRPGQDLDRAGLRQMFTGLMLRYPSIVLVVSIEEVRVTGATATARLGVLATGGQGLIPEAGQAWAVDTDWRLEGSQWKLFAADWRGRG
jgi:hypothetical protein